jgi:hypothetical protein
MFQPKNIQRNNNVVIVNPKQLILSHFSQKDTLEIEQREKNTYYNKIIGINGINGINGIIGINTKKNI